MAQMVHRVGTLPARLRFSGTVLDRKGFLNVLRFCYAEDGGGDHCRDLMERGEAAVVLPVDMKAREVYMIEQGRHLRAFAESEDGRRALAAALKGADGGAFELPFDAVKTLESPAGIVDPGETPEDAAVRELHEETGIIVGKDAIEKVASYYPSVGGSTERLTAFFAWIDQPVIDGKEDGDELERIITWKMSFDEAFAALDGGRIVTASSHILLRELRLRADAR